MDICKEFLGIEKKKGGKKPSENRVTNPPCPPCSSSFLIFPNLFIPLNYFQLKSIYPAGWAPRRVIYGASGAKKMVAGNRKWK
ncbi:unnamed protein product [Meloidogyne enterolobii]|uniref:Uncharacterized protein n=1 Tax=Meloidogyne enterolobii TaxID=390850 RepID=A0ACB0YU48_MELEN